MYDNDRNISKREKRRYWERKRKNKQIRFVVTPTELDIS